MKIFTCAVKNEEVLLGCKKLMVLLFSSFIFSTGAFAGPDSFIIVVQTDNHGTSADNEFTIPTHSDSTYFYSVNCDSFGDYEAESQDGNVTCSYDPEDNSTARMITIDGDFPRIHFNNEGDVGKIIAVEQWGTQEWISMENAFNGAFNLVYVGNIAPNLSAVENMKYMFKNTFSFNQNISHWDVSNVTSMDNMFYGAGSFNQDIGDWDVSKVTSMDNMFNWAIDFNQDIGDWDVSNVVSMNEMLVSANLSVSNYDNLLLSWNNLALTPNVTLDAGFSRYCNGLNAKNNMIDTDFWTITDDEEYCDFYISSPYTMRVKNAQQEVGIITTYGGALEYSIAGGTDGDKFTIDHDSGILSFTIAPDVNNPTDRNEDNIYRVRVRANNPTYEDFQTIRVEVANNGALVPIINYLLF